MVTICNADITCRGCSAAPPIDAHAAESPIWRALADPSRRRILDLLRARPQTTGEVASAFDVSRIAVMRHLEVLAAAGLVTSRKRGRERWHYLNAIPLQQLYDRWVSSHAAVWASGLVRVQDSLRRMNSNQPAVDVALQVLMAAPPSSVFKALMEDPGGWWGPPYVRSGTTGLNLDRRLGGQLVEEWESGGAVLATITVWTRDRELELTGPFHLGLALGIARFELAPDADGTAVAFSFRAIGAIEDELVESFAKGWGELVGRRLKTFVETGRRLGIAPDPPI